MTYTEAAKHNEQVLRDAIPCEWPPKKHLTWMHKKHSSDSTGGLERWCILEDGELACLGTVQHGTFNVLVYRPIKVLKHQFRCMIKVLTSDEWLAAAKRMEAYKNNEN